MPRVFQAEKYSTAEIDQPGCFVHPPDTAAWREGSAGENKFYAILTRDFGAVRVTSNNGTSQQVVIRQLIVQEYRDSIVPDNR